MTFHLGTGHVRHRVIDEGRDIDLHVREHGHGANLVMKHFHRGRTPQTVVGDSTHNAPNALQRSFIDQLQSTCVFTLAQCILVRLGHLCRNGHINFQ